MILLSFDSQTSGSLITVKDSSGNELISVTADCSYSSVLISSPDLTTGQTYTVTCADNETDVSLSENIYGSGTEMAGGAGMGPGTGTDSGSAPGAAPGTDSGTGRPGL